MRRIRRLLEGTQKRTRLAGSRIRAAEGLHGHGHIHCLAVAAAAAVRPPSPAAVQRVCLETWRWSSLKASLCIRSVPYRVLKSVQCV